MSHISIYIYIRVYIYICVCVYECLENTSKAVSYHYMFVGPECMFMTSKQTTRKCQQNRLSYLLRTSLHPQEYPITSRIVKANLNHLSDLSLTRSPFESPWDVPNQCGSSFDLFPGLAKWSSIAGLHRWLNALHPATGKHGNGDLKLKWIIWVNDHDFVIKFGKGKMKIINLPIFFATAKWGD